MVSHFFVLITDSCPLPRPLYKGRAQAILHCTTPNSPSPLSALAHCPHRVPPPLPLQRYHPVTTPPPAPQWGPRWTPRAPLFLLHHRQWAAMCWCFVCSSTSTKNCQCSTSLGVFSRYCIYIFSREEGSLSCLRLTQGVIPMSTTRLYRGYVN
jgi:hypothetical protein